MGKWVKKEKNAKEGSHAKLGKSSNGFLLFESPTLTKLISGVRTNGSRPERVKYLLIFFAT